ncbi:MAG TPA: hypothetical protein DIC53_11785 [Synergistaceae bacterium]|mgnify:CR=1 FL=1|nr:hypothetical protein [Synergistaceae bacterium]
MAGKNVDWMAVGIGAAFVAGGVLTLMKPGLLMALLGVLVLGRGALMIASQYKKGGMEPRSLGDLMTGSVFAVIGALFLFRPGFAVHLFAYIIAAWFIFDAVNKLRMIRGFKGIEDGVYKGGIMLYSAVIAGALLLVLQPSILGLSMAVIVGISLIASGAGHMIFGFLGEP